MLQLRASSFFFASTKSINTTVVISLLLYIVHAPVVHSFLIQRIIVPTHSHVHVHSKHLQSCPAQVCFRGTSSTFTTTRRTPRRTSTTDLNMSKDANDNDDGDDTTDRARSTNNSKRLILVRHGCTHMNEYLATPGSNWGDVEFTDIFQDCDRQNLYQDSPLSKKGTRQAQDLFDYFYSSEEGRGIIRDVDLVAVSPLRRALQTAEIGILPHFLVDNDAADGGSGANDKARDIADDAISADDTRANDSNINSTPSVPFVALPLASERVYLVSDIGRPTKTLNEMFSFANFHQEFEKFDRDEWWFTVKHEIKGEDEAEAEAADVAAYLEKTTSVNELSRLHPFNYMYVEDYVEWRPNDGNQEYYSLGEPDDAFHKRMIALYNWIENREEEVICIVCHFGVLEWLVGKEFKNCEVKDVSFEQIKSHVLRT